MSNAGIFTPNDIYDLQTYGQWTPKLGELVLLETQSATNVDSFYFTNLDEDIYDIHFMTFHGLEGVSSPQTLSVRFAENGTLETTSVYSYSNRYNQADGGSNHEYASNSNGPPLCAFNNVANLQSAGYLYFYRLGNAQTYSFYTGQTAGAFDEEFKFVSGSLPQTSVVDQIKFIASGLSFSMSASLYGVKSA
tara:strand:+ start:4306 stop:4881 length:576 start_codon:yes stop_codon:yes gene_type:complete